MNTKSYRSRNTILMIETLNPGETRKLDDGKNLFNWETMQDMPTNRAFRVIEGRCRFNLTHPLGNQSFEIDQDDVDTVTSNKVGDVVFVNTSNSITSYFCFFYVNRDEVPFAHQPVINVGDTYNLDKKGFLAVAKGIIDINGTQYGVGSILKIESDNLVVTSLEKSYIGYIGERI